jgi:LmbE family N-acetylglucosaminyl deacetylase
MSVDQLPEPLDVIAVGAHPDDVEIGCGGTLALLAAQGARVGIVDLTDGEPTPRSSGPEERLDTFEVRVALATVFRRWRPRLVLGLADKTPLASPDHAQAVAITEAAVFYSRLTKWDDTFAGLPVHTVPQLLGYFLFAGVPSVPHGHFPLVVDIAGHLDTKLAAIACYASQFPPEKAHVYPRVRAMADTLGTMAGCGAGELFASVRMPCTTEPLRMLFPPREPRS